MVELEDLFFGNNQIAALPEDFGVLRSLRIAYFGENRIKKIPKSIGQLNNLIVLSFYSNLLKELPQEIGLLQDLNTLILSINRLKRLPSSIGDLKKVRNLLLRGNELCWLPNTMATLTLLEALDISDNSLVTIPPFFINYQKLRVLFLAGNPLRGESARNEGLSSGNISILFNYCERLMDAIKLWTPNQIIEKIQGNLSLADVDRIHPDLCKYAGLLQTACKNVNTDTAREVFQILAERCVLCQKNYKLLL